MVLLVFRANFLIARFSLYTHKHIAHHMYTARQCEGHPSCASQFYYYPFDRRRVVNNTANATRSSQKSALFTNNKYIIECHSVIRDLEILTQELRVVCVCVRTCTRITPQAAGHKIASVSFLAICENLSGYDK